MAPCHTLCHHVKRYLVAKRTNQVDRTRTAIIEAAGEMLFGTSQPEDFTMQNVADAAGVSHRTLYRHFESREALINAVGKSYDADMAGSVPADILESFQTWTDAVDGIVKFGRLHHDVLRKVTAFSVINGEWRSDRDEAYWRMFRAEFPHLDEAEARQDFAVFRHVLGAASAVMIGERFELEPDEVTAAMSRGVWALMADIRRRDEEAKTRGEGS